jgi:hypothetical protein
MFVRCWLSSAIIWLRTPRAKQAAAEITLPVIDVSTIHQLQVELTGFDDTPESLSVG